MENTPLLTIAIPTFNRAGSLGNLLHNIFGQAGVLPGEVEICISSNASTDNTREVVMGFKQRHPAATIIYHEHEKNLGFDKNLLKVIEMANSRFIWTFGDDDVIAEGSLAKVVALIKQVEPEKTGLLFMRREQYVVDSKTSQKIVCYSTVDKAKPETFVMEKKDIIGMYSPDPGFMTALIFNGTLVKRIIQEEAAMVASGTGTNFMQVLLHSVLFLKYRQLSAISLNTVVISQELPAYKYFVEDNFTMDYVVQKKLNAILLSCPYMDSQYAPLCLRANKNLLKKFVAAMVKMKALESFHYHAYRSCIKLFFQSAPLLDAAVFTSVFSLLFLVPTALLQLVYKLFLRGKYGKDWKLRWLLAYAPTKGSRRWEFSSKENQKKKKVIFFVPALDMGGAQRIISELSLQLPETIERIIVLFKKQETYPFEFKARMMSLDMPFDNVLPMKIYYFFVGIWRLKKIIAAEKPDHVISFCSAANIMNIFATKQNILRIDNYSSAAEPAMYKLLAKLFFRKARLFVAVSQVAAQDLVENFGVKPENIKTIYNPSDIATVRRLSQEGLPPEYQAVFNHPVIVNIGRFTIQKGQWYLIRVFNEVKKTVPNAKLVILGGQGELEKELKRMVQDFCLEKDVYFAGWQKNPFKFLAKARVFALSSLWEGLSCAAIEAMACGLPVISTDCKAGPREILAPNTDIATETKGIEHAQFGVLTQAFSGKKYASGQPLERSEELFRDALVEMLSNPLLARDLGEKSKRRSEDFDIPKIMQAWDFLQT